MHEFTFHSPETIAEALALLDQHAGEARVIAGGTALVLLMKQSLVQPRHVVSLDRVEGLGGIRLDDDGLHIGATARHRDVETSDLVRAHAPLLGDVYGRVSTVRIRNAATVGGGLAHADPAQDPPAALIALNASVRLVSSAGERTVPLDELFIDYYETTLAPGEIVREVVVPLPEPRARSVYLKFLPRTKDDYATVAVAAHAELDGARCERLRVALIAVGPTPLRALAVERALEGSAVTAGAIQRAAEAVADAVDPLDDFRGSAGYKRDMAVVFTRRALEQVLLPAAS